MVDVKNLSLTLDLANYLTKEGYKEENGTWKK